MTTDVHTLSGAYALDALSDEEAADFREHLAGCQACRDEVRELRNAAALMGAATWAAPPPALRRRVLTLADRTPQIPPARTAGTQTPSGPSAPSAPSAPDSTEAGAPQPVPGDELSTRRTARRDRSRWRTWAASVAAAVVLIGGGAVGARALMDGPSQDGLTVAAARVFSADDARTATVGTENGGRLTVGVSDSLDEMAVDARDLPKLDGQHVYQVWSVHDGRSTSAALLNDLDGGAAMGIPSDGAQVALTVEPKGGSEQPTTDPVVVVDPAQV